MIRPAPPPSRPPEHAARVETILADASSAGLSNLALHARASSANQDCSMDAFAECRPSSSAANQRNSDTP